jgi:hypothetical protein
MAESIRLEWRLRRAYELGRIKMALRIMVWLLPLVAVCLLLSFRPKACALIALALLAGVVLLRWRGRKGIEQANFGLIAGLLPLAAALASDRIQPLLGTHVACTGVCMVVAFASGIWLGIRMTKAHQHVGGLLLACTIAAATASLGCLNLGLSGVAGIALGLASSSLAGVAWVRTPT